jgi:hypothetical protein
MVTLVPVIYSIDVDPQPALLGEPLTAVLRCVATTEARAAMTFDHRSLRLELERTSFSEPLLAFPNRHAIAVKGMLIRLASTLGIEDLSSGEERTRSFDLLSLFPDGVLNVGTFALTYRLEEADPVVCPLPTKVGVASGPEAVPLLIRHLGSEVLALRFRAFDLLTKMTGRRFTYAADAAEEQRSQAIALWWTWWQSEGVEFPWNFLSDGATFGITPEPPPPSHRGAQLGGVAFPGDE